MTKKELQYVRLFAREVPYPGLDYCKDVMDKLEECYHKFNSDRYTIEFSDNKRIFLYTWFNNITNLLGIDYKNISGHYFDNYRRDILGLGEKFDTNKVVKAIVENKERVISYDDDRRSLLAINYYKLDAKCSAFLRFSDLSMFDYGCIDFDSKLYQRLTHERIITPDVKFLYASSGDEEIPYYLLAIKKSDQQKYAIAGSYVTQHFYACEYPKKYFNGQNVILPCKVKKGKEEKTISRKEMIELLEEYKDIISEYDLESRLKISKEKRLLLK